MKPPWLSSHQVNEYANRDSRRYLPITVYLFELTFLDVQLLPALVGQIFNSVKLHKAVDRAPDHIDHGLRFGWISPLKAKVLVEFFTLQHENLFSVRLGVLLLLQQSLNIRRVLNLACCTLFNGFQRVPLDLPPCFCDLAVTATGQHHS